MNKWTAPKISALKNKQRIAVLTAYDAATARLIDEAGLPVILVGDSLGMTALGYATTLPVTLEQMLHHTAAVVRGVKSSLVVTDLPFLTYQASIEQAITSAGRCLKEAGADAVKIEGGEFRAPTIRALVENGIPVMAHIGLLPQNVKTMGGYKIQGRTDDSAQQLLRDAKAITDAGAFSVVIEGVAPDVAAQITKSISIPTIGIGAGPGCDGQVLVINDILGLTQKPPPFAKKYADISAAIRTATETYRREVESGAFPPDPAHSN